jgi:hypothetical protein
LSENAQISGASNSTKAVCGIGPIAKRQSGAKQNGAGKSRAVSFSLTNERPN